MFGGPRSLVLLTGVALWQLSNSPSWAAGPSAADALRLSPIQTDVRYDTPEQTLWSKCTIQSESMGSASGWVVRNPEGQMLRRFVDTNGDNKVDQWCYYEQGVEVYRDVDANFNGKADQYRWLGTAGLRWGLDADEDGQVDTWKWISAEEVTAEVVLALRDKDAARFRRLLLTSSELKSLGLSKERTSELEKKLAGAAERFAQLAGKQDVVKKASTWVHFGGTRPGVIPSGTNGSEKDLVLYDNVAAVIETDGQHSQVPIGTLVRVAEGWRLIDLPNVLLSSDVASVSGYFFQASLTSRPEVVAGTESGLSEEQQQLIAQLEDIDKDLQKAATPEKQAELNRRRADVLEKLAAAVKDPQERTTWLRQLADTISAAVQAGGYPDGVQRLKTLASSLTESQASKDDVAYVTFRSMTAEYGQAVQEPNANFAKIQEQWLENLKKFVEQYPQSEDAAEAMLQLAIAEEFAGEEAAASEWYARIRKEFPSSDLAKKAEGAQRRLQSVGQPMALQGKTLDNKNFDLAQLRGRVVLVHYWATWCEPCKEEMKTLKKLAEEFGPKGFALVGVNLDGERAEAQRYVSTASVNWTHLYEAGGLDSRLANEFGILTLPTMLLIDKQGRVISRNIHVGQLSDELQKQLR